MRGKNIVNIITWNNKFYGVHETKKFTRYYKSDNCRFDNTYGITEEISLEEYNEVAVKYADIFR